MPGSVELTTCQACGADLRGRAVCHQCGAVVFVVSGEQLTWALGELVEVTEQGEHLDLTVEMTGGQRLAARAGPGCQREGPGAPRRGDMVEVLGRRREIFDERTGGMRQAPEHRSLLALTALAWGSLPMK